MRKICSFRLILPSLLSGRPYACEDGDVRLVDGFDSRSGRVEFCNEAEWGTVCDDDWNNEAAVVVCRQLGLPTSNASFLSSFGGGNGRIALDNMVCNGNEQRLEMCSSTSIGVHNCDHTEDVGIICAQDESECVFNHSSSGEPTLTYPVSRTCLQRYGHCVPFRKHETESICDEFYTPGVDYIYVPNTRIHGQYSKLMKYIVNFGSLVLGSLEKCSDFAKQAICHYYLPPCGNSSVFELPTSVCRETCQILQETCGEDWEMAIAVFQQNTLATQEEIDVIACEDPGKPLSPLPYNCTRLEYEVIPTANTTSALERNGALFSAIPAAAIIITLAIITTIVSALKMKRKEETRSSLKSFDGNTPQNKGPNRPDNTTEQTSPMHLPRPDVNLSTTYLHQLTEEGLLIPKHKINLSGTVGKGEFGVVYKATLNGWQGNHERTVAVKTLKVFSPMEQKRLIEESLVMIKFNHMNAEELQPDIGIYRYLGQCTECGIWISFARSTSHFVCAQV